MDVQTPPAPVPTEPFTMADANRVVSEQILNPLETAVTEDKPPTKVEDSATPPKEDVEVPPFLQEEEKDDTPFDLDNPDIDNVLKDVPDEERKGSYRKGIEKVIKQARTARDEAESAKDEALQMQERLTPIMSYLDAFQNAETRWGAYNALGKQLAQLDGNFDWQPGETPKPQGTQQTSMGSDEDTLWQSEQPSETKARWKQEFLAEFKKEFAPMLDEVKGILSEKLEPVSKWHETEKSRAETTSKLEQNYPTVHGRYPFATKEMLQKAITENPGMDPMKAFRAEFADDIGRYAAEYQKKLGAKPAGPQVTHQTPALDSHERPTTMAGIYQEIGLRVE